MKLLTLLLLSLCSLLHAQGGFTFINDPLNPVFSFSNTATYRGAAWVDIDNDNDIDLFCSPDNLFINDGRGNFTIRTTQIGSGQQQNPTGVTFADFDNDGDIDCFLARGPSFLYLNDGNGNFTTDSFALQGLSATVNGWGAAFGDYNNDGVPDLVIAHPAGFLPNPSPSFLFKGTQNKKLQNVTGYTFTTTNAPYTVPYWSDFDLDGDIDLFIASGPGGSAGKDFLYKNLLVETGIDSFARITDLPFASQNQDGQTYNFVDYDNDGDLDLCLTNWGGAPNRLYRNDAGVYTAVAAPFTSQNQTSLGNCWGDFDNDGDLDLVIANDTQFFTGFYLNNGDGTFTAKATAFTTKKGANSPVIGDYDNDGDLDLFIHGHNIGKGLFRNDSLATGKNFLSLRVNGTTANKSAIGAKVRVKANINGASVWQMRDISAQNSFQGMNDLRVHVGLNSASVADSIIITYPSGTVDVYTNVAANRFYTVSEGDAALGVVTSAEETGATIPDTYRLRQNYPNPFNPETTITFAIPSAEYIKLSVYALNGSHIADLAEGILEAGEHSRTFNGAGLPSGIYIYRLFSENKSITGKMTLLK